MIKATNVKGFVDVLAVTSAARQTSPWKTAVNEQTLNSRSNFLAQTNVSFNSVFLRRRVCERKTKEQIGEPLMRLCTEEA